MTPLIVLVAIVVLAAVLVLGARGRMAALRRRADRAFIGVDVQLKQRHDLIPDLVEAARGCAGCQERAALDALIAARNAASMAHSIPDKAAAENDLSAALQRVLARPELEAGDGLLRLRDELGDIEDKLAIARRSFDDAVGDYNGAIGSPLAFGFRPRQRFDQ